jgi:hypothetical protein
MTEKHQSLLALYQSRTGRTTHIPGEMDNPRKLSQYFRARADLNNGADTSRWR